MTLKNFTITANKWRYHIAFWIFWVALNTIFLGSAEDTYRRQFITELYELPEKMIVVYLNLYWLVPRYLLKKKYYQYGFALFFLLFFMSLVMRAVYVEFLARQYYPDTAGIPYFHAYRLFKYIFYNLNAVIFITTGIRLFYYWYQQQERNHELAQQNLKTELYYLKGQLHPHFLFNTLNNIYSLCLKKSDIAAPVVLKLSGLMRYMLYDSQKDLIDLNEDIKYIKGYIELEKIRYGDRISISFNESGDLSGKQIAPLLMLPFVENAFKHGLCEDTENVWITIDLKVKQEIFYFKIRNSVNALLGNHKPDPKGFGLQNLRRRLELLYPQAHEMEIRQDIDFFEVDLKIKL
jgi:sensor histidine kinase YesM